MLLPELLRTVTLPHWRRHRLRTLLTAVGVALGVATVVAVTDVSRTVLGAFHGAVETVAGAGALELAAPSGLLDEALLSTVRDVPGVSAAEGIVEAFVPLPTAPGMSLYVFGVDFLGSDLWSAQLPRTSLALPDELVFLAKADSVVLTRRFARDQGISDGGSLAVLAPAGVRTLVARGLMDDAPLARLFDGLIAVMDLPAAQRLLARDGRLDRIVVAVTPGADVERVRSRIAAAVGPAAVVQAPEARGARVEQLLFSLRSMLAAAGSLAVIVGAFIVFHAVAVSVYQRRRELALLNVVGIRRRTLVQLCLVETALLAALGSVGGIAGGRALARLASGLVGSTASEIWVQLSVGGTTHTALSDLLGGGIGALVALVATLLAVRTTFRASSVEALRPVAVDLTSSTPATAWPVLVGVGLVAVTWLIARWPPDASFASLVGSVIAAQALAYAGGALIAPWAVRAGGTLMRIVARRVSWLPLRLAADSIPRTPARTGAALAAVTASVGMAITLSALVQSFDGAWTHWIEQHFAADLFVGGGDRFRLMAGPPMAADVAARVRAIEGVADVEVFRTLQLTLPDRVVFLESVDLERRPRHGGLAMVEGDLAAAAPALRDGTGVLLSDNLATRMGLRRGDVFTLPTPTGERPVRVEGTFVDYLGSLDLGAVVVAETQLRTVWGDTQANMLRVWVAPATSPAAAAARIRRALPSGYWVVTAGDFLDGVRGVLAAFFAATWALQLVAALVGVIGILNNQMSAVLDRTPEIAMLRVIGVRTRDVARAIVIECAGLGAIGGILGSAIGLMLGVQFVTVSLWLVTGWRVPFSLSAWTIPACVALGTLVAAVAGGIPAVVASAVEPRLDRGE